jgi:hypothetical protein
MEHARADSTVIQAFACLIANRSMRAFAVANARSLRRDETGGDLDLARRAEYVQENELPLIRSHPA